MSGDHPRKSSQARRASWRSRNWLGDSGDLPFEPMPAPLPWSSLSWCHLHNGRPRRHDLVQGCPFQAKGMVISRLGPRRPKRSRCSPALVQVDFVPPPASLWLVSWTQLFVSSLCRLSQKFFFFVFFFFFFCVSFFSFVSISADLCDLSSHVPLPQVSPKRRRIRGENA